MNALIQKNLGNFKNASNLKTSLRNIEFFTL